MRSRPGDKIVIIITITSFTSFTTTASTSTINMINSSMHVIVVLVLLILNILILRDRRPLVFMMRAAAHTLVFYGAQRSVMVREQQEKEKWTNADNVQF